MLASPSADAHKYSRGVLGVRTGSSAYPGAAVLGVEAAWRTGIGLVQFFTQLDDSDPPHGLPTPAAAVLSSRPETVFPSSTETDHSRVTAWLIGSGTDPQLRSAAETEALITIVTGSRPVVVDAGALDVLTRVRPTAPIIVTPHLGEFHALAAACGLDRLDTSSELARATSALAVAERLGVVVLLKGSTTISAAPTGFVYAAGPATPWLATAGTGDVLAGILGALVAGHPSSGSISLESLAQLGVTAAQLHDSAARIACQHGEDEDAGPDGPITALDVAHAVPRTIAAILG